MRVFGYIDFEGCEIIDARCTVGPADIFLWLFHFKLSIAVKFQSSPGCQRVENNEKQETSSGAMKHCFESLDFDQRFCDCYQTARYGRGSKCKAPIHTWTHRRSIAPIHPHDPYIASGYDPYPSIPFIHKRKRQVGLVPISGHRSIPLQYVRIKPAVHTSLVPYVRITAERFMSVF